VGLKSLLERIPIILGLSTETSGESIDLRISPLTTTLKNKDIEVALSNIKYIENERENEMENPQVKSEISVNAKPKDKRVETFGRVCSSCEKLFEQKNDEYGDTIVATGVLGASVELIGVVARLKKLVLQAPDGGKANMTALADVFKDIHNYANIGLMMMNEDNWKGK